MAHEIQLGMKYFAKSEIDDAISMEDAKQLALISQKAVLTECVISPEFLERFRVQVDTTTMQIVAALPHISEQALLKGVWQAFENGIYMYDPEAEGSFEDYVEHIMGWLGEDHSASKKSDLMFWCVKAFPFCKAHGISIAGIIANISKARAAVPVLRDLYEDFEKGKLTTKQTADQYGKIVKMISDPKLTVVEFNKKLKSDGLKATLIDPYMAYDWPVDGKSGSISIAYASETDRQRILNRLSTIVDIDKVSHYQPGKSVQTDVPYSIWAGDVMCIVLSIADPAAVHINRRWDGIDNWYLAWNTNEAGKKNIDNIMKLLQANGVNCYTIDNDQYQLVVKYPEQEDDDEATVA